MPRQRESILKDKVLADLRALPEVWAVKIQQVATRGTPDILATVAGFFVAIELKRDENAPITALQEHTLSKIRAAGGRGYVVHPLNWPGVLAELKGLAARGQLSFGSDKIARS